MKFWCLLALMCSCTISFAQIKPVGTNLPEGWVVADIGAVRSPGSASYDPEKKEFTIRSYGRVTEKESTFVYKKVKGDFMATCRVTASSKLAVGGGLMIRTDLAVENRFLKNAFNSERFGNGPATHILQTDGMHMWTPGDIAHVQPLPCWVRIIRHGDSVASYYSADGKEWNLMHFGGTRFSPNLPEEVLVGITNALHDSDDPNGESAVIDNVSIEQPLNLPYTTSWLGNTWASNYYQGHVQMQITGMIIDRTGKEPRLRISGQNEAYDSSLYDLDGNLLYMYQLEHGGTALRDQDGAFIYEATGGNDNGLSKLKRISGANLAKAPDTDPLAQAMSLRGTQMTGLAAGDGKVYVSEANEQRVVVLDGITLEEIASFPMPRPGSLALDQSEGIWVVQREGNEPSYPYRAKDGETPEVRGTNTSNSPDGKVIDPAHYARINYLTLDGKRVPAKDIDFSGLPQPVRPTGMAVHPKTGHLYVCDVGPNQCVWIFDRTGKQVGRIGAVGGVYKNKVPGTVDAGHLYFPRAVTIDDQDNIYIAMCPRQGWVGGALMRKYDPTGTKILWERQGLEFQEAASGDPGTDGVDVFTQTHRYRMDFSKSNGKEATYVAMTFDPFTYPKDTRNTTNGGANNATAVRRIAGQRIMFLHQWARNGEAIFRFEKNSEIAIPSGLIGNLGFWIDTNGDGQMDDAEMKPKVAFGSCWTLDLNGDIWSVGGKTVRCWRNQGLNDKGVPIYTHEPTETYDIPEPYTDVHYVVYDAIGDRLFLGGFTKDLPKDSKDHGGSLGQWLSCYENVRANKSLDKLRWARTLPYEFGEEGLGRETNCFFTADYAGDEKGGYLFIGGLSERGVKKTSIWGIDALTGEMVERFLPGPEVAGYGGWFDFNNTVNAFKRSDGEYIIYAEDDGAQKVNMFRWKP